MKAFDARMQWPVIDNDAGTVKVVHSQMNPAEPVSGSGALFTVMFRADAEAQTPLCCSARSRFRPGWVLIPCDIRSGAVRLGITSSCCPVLLDALSPL